MLSLLPMYKPRNSLGQVHQDYYAKNPLSPYCVMNIGSKLVKLRPDISKVNRQSREREDQNASS